MSASHPSSPAAPTVFARAARIFDGWTDPETGVAVLRVEPRGVAPRPGAFATPYQQCFPFRDGGRRVELRQAKPGQRAIDHDSLRAVLDLATGELEPFTPAGYDDAARVAVRGEPGAGGGTRMLLIDRHGGETLAALESGDWKVCGVCPLADGRRAVVPVMQGRPYDEHCRTRMHLLVPGEAPRCFLELDGVYGNHLMPCPTDPNLFSYNAWPTPRRDIDGVTAIASVDGSTNDYVPLDAAAPRPGDFWGVRDHYVWTPDGRRIVSYLNVSPTALGPDFNHFHCDWWLSALDWRTGEDFCAPYPPGRWGGHMQVTPDSRWIVHAGGPGFDALYATGVAALRDGWNEHVICRCPATNPAGGMAEFYPYPFVLPDGSGVLFNAGWPGDAHGLFLAAWPDGLGLCGQSA